MYIRLLFIFIELTLDAEETEKSNVLIFRPAIAAADDDDVANLTRLVEVCIKVFFVV